MAVYPNGLTTPPTVTDVFGYRVHPIYGDRRLHTGTDSVNHPRGRNYAPEGGIVTFAGYNGGAGNQVSWDVPGTNRQWRAKHHAAFEVGRGEQINMAQSLGITGTTGDSTGVHCHLELLIGGEYVDPFAWIALNLSTTAGTSATPLNNEEDDMKLTRIIFDQGPSSAPGFASTAIITPVTGFVKTSDGYEKREALEGYTAIANVLQFPVVEAHVDSNGWRLAQLFTSAK